MIVALLFVLGYESGKHVGGIRDTFLERMVCELQANEGKCGWLL